MKSKGKLWLTLVLTISAITMAGFAAFAAAGYDPNEPMSVTVKPADDCVNHINMSAQYGHIVYDLYEIEKPDVDLTDASAVAAFNFSDYAQTKLAELMAGGKIGIDAKPVNGSAAYTDCTLSSKQAVDPAFYLLVARGAADTAANEMHCESVITSVQKIAADGTSSSKQLATYSRIGAYYFTIAPQVICVPTKVDDQGNIVSDTTQEGTWVYDQTITLKMLTDPETGDIIINKTLTGINIKDTAIPMIFLVECFYPDENTPYSSEVYSMVFTKAGTQQLVVKGFPVGSTVHVYEVYSGANYKANIQYPNGLHEVIKDPLVPVEYDFVNDYNDDNKGNGGLTNHFEYIEKDGNITWEWEQLPDGNINSNNGRIKDKISELLKAPVQSLLPPVTNDDTTSN